MLKLAHACTYSFYRIENCVNNSRHDSYGVTPDKVLSIMKDYLEPTFVLIFNLEAAVKISLVGWNTYRKFSSLATSGHFLDTGISLVNLMFSIPGNLIDNR